ncbi:MAG TPA: hypothetical protein VF808_06330 [Ktedonobacterales bacterium]
MEPQSRAALLLERLDAIGASLAESGHALALIGLGSVGAELGRLDVYSDLDFFAIVQPGFKERFIGDLVWLARVHPIAFAFPNTRDGDKVLFADGVYAEFAVFIPDELGHIPAHGARVVWQTSGFDCDALLARAPEPPAPEPPAVEWLTGEILTNLYVGLTRYRRGERLSAMRLIQTHAVDRLIELSARIEPAAAASADPFALERRYEARYPQTAALLPQFAQGYERSVESALAILAFIDRHFPAHVNAALKRRILDLCAPVSSGGQP